ncbi:hypothetical protein [Alterisphingorhabdus coralli]|uniref:HTH marR-type domain-containing protein n=1 Tax=Alterisphingorhabdus coralli TaxID=3071408 RepID=A0AA97F614_9SPHN|nr:hypothetical protein [Parasphingorhabdus sp. SCSIO 66989]WOE74593.1 hypothetical protein RB602_12155 [Parasphingorhabdus sp. SCSIO 66989]
MSEFDRHDRELIEEFIEAIDAIPDVHALLIDREITADNGARADGLVEMHVNNEPHLLLIEAKKQIFPRDARQIVWRTEKFIRGVDDPTVTTAIPFVVAEALSPGAREVLREEKIGYYDSGGSLYVPITGAYIYIDKPAPKQMKKQSLAVFKGARSRVLKALFHKGREPTNVKELGSLAKVSAATASKTLQELERREWVETEGSGPNKLRRLRYPMEILDAWTGFLANEKPTTLRRYYVPISSMDSLVFAIETEFSACRDLRYALTGEIAAQTYAPYLTSISTVHCRISSHNEEHDALASLDARPVTEGWNLVLIDTSSHDFIGATVAQGMRLVSPLQIYLDLFLARGRAKELAIEFREKVLLPQW